MTQILRQSTEVIVRIGPAVAVADGFTPVTTLDLSTADEAELLKANTATTTDISAATLAAITGCDGWYGLTLTTSLTDTVGCLDVMVNDDSLMLPIFARFQVIEEAAYDAMFAASAAPATAAGVSAVETDTQDIQSRLPAALVNSRMDSTVDGTGLEAAAAAVIADAVWDEDATGHQTTGTFGQAIGDPVADTNTIYGAVVTGAAGATVAADIIAVKAETANILDDTDDIGVAGAGLTEAGGTGDQFTAIVWNAAWDAEVQSEVTDALSAALTEAYASLGATASVAQLLYEIRALLAEKAVSSTTLTTKKLDGLTTAATYTLDDDTAPSSITRAS
jgi:hypothetical protein